VHINQEQQQQQQQQNDNKSTIMMPSATLDLLVYPKDFDACLQPCSFLSVSLVCSLRETIARKKSEKKNEENK
jgi:hypothetical protein